MAHYDDLVLPNTMSFGSAFGPKPATQVLRTVNGFRKTNKLRDNHLHEFEVEYAVEADEDIYVLKEIYEAVDGPFGSFLARDWSDWNTTRGKMGGEHNASDPTSATDQPLINNSTASTAFGSTLGDGTATAFKLVKRYSPPGSAASHDRDIIKPEITNFKIAINPGGSTISGAGYTLNTTDGTVALSTAPTSTEYITWGGQYLVASAFMVDTFAQLLNGYNDNSIVFPLEEVFGV